VNCGKCGIELPPGASHPGIENCFEALKHENMVLAMKLGATCPKCNLRPVCACDVKRVARTEISKRSPQAAQALQILGELLKP
jgi:hypothetical protein